MALRSPFVGRADVVRSLNSRLDERPGLVLVVGDAGIGKSRLVQEILSGRPGGHLLGACLPLQRSLPLLPFVEMFSARHDAHARQRLRHALAALPRALQRAMSPVLEVQGAAEAPDHEADLQRLFFAVEALLVSMGDREPVVAVVEDVHWADSATLDLLTLLTDRLRNTPATVLATYRSDDLAARSAHAVEWLANMQRAEGAASLTLVPMTREEVVEQLAALLGSVPVDEVVDTVFRRSEGNPFFTEQLVAAMASGATDAALPERLADFLRAQVRGVSRDAGRLLGTQALAARPLRAEHLLQMAGLEGDRGGEALAELQDAALITSTDEGLVRARHALLSETALREVLLEDRGETHRRIAELLAVEDGDALAAEIAEHWRQTSDREAELGWAEVAADNAWRVGAWPEAAHWLRRVLTLADEVPDGVERTRTSIVELHCRAIRAIDLAGDRAASDALGRAAYQRFADWPVPSERAKLLTFAAHHHALLDLEVGQRMFPAALEVFEQLPASPEYAEALAIYGSTFGWQGNHQRSREILEQALEVAEATGAEVEQAKIHSNLAWVCWELGDLERAERHLDLAAVHAGRVDDPMSAVHVDVIRSDFLLRANRLGEAARVAEAGLRVARSEGVGTSYLVHVLLYNAVDAALLMGRTAAAAELVVDATDHPVRDDLDLLRELRAEVELRRGRVADGLLRLTAPSVQPPLLGEEQASRAARLIELRRWAGEVDEALDTAQESVDRLGVGSGSSCWDLLTAAAGAAADAAEHSRARRSDAQPEVSSFLRRLELLAAGSGARVDREVAAPAFLAQWAAERVRAEGADDPELWLAAAQTWTSLGRPPRAAYCWWRRAEALLATGPAGPVTGPAGAALQNALEAADGHVPLQEAVAGLASRAHLRLHDGAVQGLSGAGPEPELPVQLTDQEVRVLRLVAAGMTNAQIGSELFISPKTVSVHVSNVLRKLGVENRVQAASWADRVGLTGGTRTLPQP